MSEEEIIDQYVLTVSNLERQIECVKAQARQRILSLEYQINNLNDEYKTRLNLFYEQEKTAGKVKGKTLHLPCGLNIVSVKKAKQLIISDDKTLLEWAANNDPEMIITETYVSKSKLCSYYRMTGEIPPGTFVTDDSEVIQIRNPRGVK